MLFKLMSEWLPDGTQVQNPLMADHGMQVNPLAGGASRHGRRRIHSVSPAKRGVEPGEGFAGNPSPIPLVATLGLCLALVPTAFGAFGLATSTDFYTVDTDAGLVFKVRRTDNGSSTQSPGDIASLVYNGVEYQNQSKGSHINSGFDFLGYSNSTVNVSAAVVNAETIRITVETANLTHYYIARNGNPHIHMATWFDVQPVTGGGLCRFIVRIPYSLLPNGPAPSDLSGTTSTVESGDIFGLPNGETRSKHYSNMRLIDWSYMGATGSGVGVFIVRSNHEGDSGGPFYRSLLNQGGGDQEITYILNYGQAQTEPFRTGILNGPYTLVFTDGRQPDPDIDYSWIEPAGLNLVGWVSDGNRGAVQGAVSGVPDGFEAVVGFANPNAQYWAKAANGSYSTPLMIPGTYTATLYRQELSVATDSVTVTAGNTNTLNLASTETTPPHIWRLGDWDGTPAGFRNGDKITSMHPSDVRMESWAPWPFSVGTSDVSDFPCVQFRGANTPAVITFNLTAAQAADDRTLQIGTTCAYNGGRPRVTVNGWVSSIPPAPPWSGTRNITTGTYREFNLLYTYVIPASALNAGENTLSIEPISGSSDLGPWLSACFAYDAIELRGTPAGAPAAPVGLAAGTADSRVELSWKPVLSATRYIVRRAFTADGPYTLLSDNVGPTRFIDTTVTHGTASFYRVSAANVFGEGEYADVIAIPSHLQTHLTFDEGSGATAADSVGDNDGTLAAGAGWTSGQINSAIQLDGSADGYVALPPGLVSALDDFTIACWVNPQSTPTWSRIFDFGSGTESYMFLTPVSDGGTVRYGITTASGGGEQQLNYSGTLSPNVWHHVAVTLSGNSGRLFVDGVLQHVNPFMSLRPSDLGVTTDNYIGRSQWPDPYPNVGVDDFRIYNRALSGSEIASLASQTVPDPPAGLTADALTNDVTLEWTASSGAVSYNVHQSTTNGGPYALLAGGLNTTNLTYPSIRSGTNYYVVSAVNIAGESAYSPEAQTFVIVPSPPPTPVAPLAYYRFEEGSAGTDVPVGGSAVLDLAGGDDPLNAFSSGASPTYSSLAPASIIPQTGQSNVLSLHFDGNDDVYTDVVGPFRVTPIGDFTVEAYVRFTSLSGWQTIVGRDDTFAAGGGQDGHPQALFYLSKNGINHGFRVEASTTGGNLIAYDSASIAQLNTWHHVAAVGETHAGTLALYVDGAWVGEAAGYDGLFDPAEDNAWTIGRGQYDGAVADNVSGYIDEVRFTASALTPDRFLNAVNPDTDADGLADAWEIDHFGNLGQTGTDDPDGDGDDNETEETNGTDPNVSSVPPVLLASTEGGLLTLSWPLHHTGWRLEVQTRSVDTGLGTNWQTVIGSDQTNLWSSPVRLTNGSVFFRLVYP